MADKKQLAKREGYSLNEIKDKFLPNRDMASLEGSEKPLTRDTFLDILKKVSLADYDRHAPKKSKTSE